MGVRHPAPWPVPLADKVAQPGAFRGVVISPPTANGTPKMTLPYAHLGDMVASRPPPSGQGKVPSRPRIDPSCESPAASSPEDTLAANLDVDIRSTAKSPRPKGPAISLPDFRRWSAPTVGHFPLQLVSPLPGKRGTSPSDHTETAWISPGAILNFRPQSQQSTASTLVLRMERLFGSFAPSLVYQTDQPLDAALVLMPPAVVQTAEPLLGHLFRGRCIGWRFQFERNCSFQLLEFVHA